MNMQPQNPHDGFCAHCDRGLIQINDQGHATDCPLHVAKEEPPSSAIVDLFEALKRALK